VGCQGPQPELTELIDAAAPLPAPDAALVSRGDAQSPTEQERMALVAAELWSAVPTERDPFLPWAEAEVDCNPLVGFYAELGALEIDTGRCNFVTLDQTLPVALPEGAELEVELVHFDLVAAAPASARAALLFARAADDLDGAEPATSWERRVAIPAPADRIVDRFRMNRSHSAGDRVLFHLQNHGQNTWMLVRIDWLRTP
jgi:hypothetical protein